MIIKDDHFIIVLLDMNDKLDIIIITDSINGII